MPKFREIEGIRFYPLTIGQIQDYPEEMQALMGVTKGENPFDPERFAKLTKLYAASASRGAEITIEQIRNVVDMDTIAKVNRAVLGNFNDPTDANLPVGEEPTPMRPQSGASSTPK